MTKTNELLASGIHFSIRQATPEDASSIQKLMLEIAQWLKDKGSTQWNELLQGKDVHHLKQKITANEVFLVSQNEQIAGAMILQNMPNDWDKSLWQEDTRTEACYLHRLMVSRSFSGHHLSLAMIEYAENLARSQQIPKLRLDTKSDVPFLNKLYQSAGFTLKGVQKGYSLYEKVLH